MKSEVFIKKAFAPDEILVEYLREDLGFLSRGKYYEASLLALGAFIPDSIDHGSPVKLVNWTDNTFPGGSREDGQETRSNQ